jgi:hypothetical protein
MTQSALTDALNWEAKFNQGVSGRVQIAMEALMTGTFG